MTMQLYFRMPAEDDGGVQFQMLSAIDQALAEGFDDRGLDEQIRELEVLGDADPDDKELSARTYALMQEREAMKVAFENLPAERKKILAGLPELEWIQITCHELARMDFAHYESLWNEARDHFEAETGLKIDAKIDPESEVGRFRRGLLLRAGMLASVKHKTNFREGTTAYYADTCTLVAGQTPNDDTVWSHTQIPADWTTPDGMLNVMPWILFNHWAELAHTVNAGILPLAPDFLAGERVKIPSPQR